MHFVHKYQDTDQHICFEDMLCYEHNQNLEHILADSPNMDLLEILVDMCRYHCCIEHLLRKEMGNRGLREQVLLLFINLEIRLVERD